VLVDREAIGFRLREGLGRRLEQALEAHRQYQAGQGREPYGAPQLAQEIGVSPEAVRTWIAAKHLPALDLVAAAAGHSYGHRTYERTVRADEVKLLAREGQTAMLLTAQGEEVVRSAVDADGEVLPGFLVVRGLRRNLMDFDAIALVVGRSTAWVRRTWSAAAAKLRASQR
jgi:hypothetical protein